jgi:glutamyl-tRNA reductase
VGHVVTAQLAASAAAARNNRPQVYLDLALPRDVDPAAAQVDGVHVVDLEALGRGMPDGSGGEHVEQARAIVSQEVADYLTARRAESVAPTVVALRTRAREVVEAELARLAGRLPDLDDAVRAEVERTVHRVVEKLLHTPTVRVKQLATAPGGDAYADALRALFDLPVETDPDVFAVATDRAAALSSPQRLGGAA